MTHVAAAAGLVVLTALCCACVAALVGAIVAPTLARRVAAWSAASRHRGLFALAVAPLSLGAALFVSALSRAFLGLAVPSLDHCAAHDDAHAHLCFVHLPHHAIHPVVGAALLALGIAAALGLFVSMRRLVRAMAVVRSLVRTGKHDATLGATIVAIETPVCMTAGLLRPTTILSRGFVRTVSARHRDIVLAHERAHARRRDALVGVVAALASRLYLPALRQSLLDELALAAEEACDAEAALACGGRVDVAEAILSVERSLSSPVTAGAFGAAVVAFGEVAVSRRIEALLAPPARAGSLRVAALVSLCLAVGLAVAAPHVHHAAESVLSHLVE